MYSFMNVFLILTPELSVILLSSCLLYRLFEDFPGTSPALVQAPPPTTFTVLYSVSVLFFVCVHLKEQLLWFEKRA